MESPTGEVEMSPGAMVGVRGALSSSTLLVKAVLKQSSKAYLSIPEQQEGRQALHIEALCQDGLFINIHYCMIHRYSLSQLRPGSFIP